MYYLCIITCKLNVALKLLHKYIWLLFLIVSFNERWCKLQNTEVICEYVIILVI